MGEIQFFPHRKVNRMDDDLEIEMESSRLVLKKGNHALRFSGGYNPKLYYRRTGDDDDEIQEKMKLKLNEEISTENPERILNKFTDANFRRIILEMSPSGYREDHRRMKKNRVRQIITEEKSITQAKKDIRKKMKGDDAEDNFKKWFRKESTSVDNWEYTSDELANGKVVIIKRKVDGDIQWYLLYSDGDEVKTAKTKEGYKSLKQFREGNESAINRLDDYSPHKVFPKPLISILMGEFHSYEVVKPYLMADGLKS